MRGTRVLASFGLGIVVAFAAPSVDAAIDKCQASMEKEAAKLYKDAEQRLEKCLDFIQKEKAKRKAAIEKDPVKADLKPNWDFTKAADSCEKQLSKTFGPGGAISKYDAKFNALFPSKCTSEDLILLNNLVGGGSVDAGAPGSTVHGFLREWIKVGRIDSAVVSAYWQNRVARTLIQNAIDGFPLGDYGKEKTPTVDCSSNHPFLCLFHKDPASGDNSFVPSTGALATMCRSHSCILDANEQSEAQSNSKSSVNLPAIGVIPLALPGVATYSICNLDVPFVAEEFRDFRFLYSGPTRTFTRITEFLGQIVCVDGWSFQGWCACSPGTGAPINANSCYDHNTDNGDSCNSPRLPVSEPCVCVDAAASNLPCGALAESSCQLERDPNGLVIPCDASATQCSAGNFCGANSGGGVCHAGLGVLPDAVKTYSGQAGVGDCMGISIGSLKLVENPEDFGPDGLPCTADDTTPRTTGGATVLTTGTSVSTIFDALFQNGICTAGSNTNAHCTSEVDCDGGELGVCEGVVPQAIFNNIGENLNGIPASGGCAQIDTSDLSGYLLVTSFASPDATAAGDLTSSSQYFCK